MAATDYDVVVVGAGPVGLALSLGLARAGHSVLVLEKDSATAKHSRAPIIWPRTLEVLAGLGVSDRFLEEGLVLSHAQIWDVDRDRVLLRVSLEDLREETALPHLLLCPQSQTECLLYEALEQEPSADVLFSAEALDLVQQHNAVEVRYDHDGTSHVATAVFAAGCDGAGSTVREVLGASFAGRTYRMQAALADITLDQDVDLPFPRMTRRQGVATAIRIDDRSWRLMLPFTSQETSQESVSLDQRIERAVSNLFSTGAFTTVWKSEFKLHKRISSQFVNGRVALAGDAAHLNSPVGGRGMNVGIQDAAALKRALLTALEQDDTGPLSVYARQRRAAIQGGMFRLLDWLTRILMIGRGGLLFRTLRFAGILLRFRPLRRVALRRLAMLDDPSRGS